MPEQSLSRKEATEVLKLILGSEFRPKTLALGREGPNTVLALFRDLGILPTGNEGIFLENLFKVSGPTGVSSSGSRIQGTPLEKIGSIEGLRDFIQRKETIFDPSELFRNKLNAKESSPLSGPDLERFLGGKSRTFSRSKVLRQLASRPESVGLRKIGPLLGLILAAILGGTEATKLFGKDET